MNDDSLWFKDAIIYEVPVRAFADSNGDGIGDFRGLTERLDYLQDLGVTALWILPFFPSPLRDDGYDISDYTSVNPIYGTIGDFKAFLQAAHDRNIRVIIELIVNHTSDQHPWFQRARRSPKGSSERDFYVWEDTPEKYQEARIIFQDFESSNWAYDGVAKAYYWHRFYSHQPDLNYDNPAVRDSVFAVLDFWLDMGVDGLRMDAVPYLFEREGTNCENLPETHDFLKQLRKRVDEKYPNRMLLAEANQWPEDAAAYYGDGDECHMNFHFPLMPRLFMALRMEDSFPIVDILQQTPAIPDNCQWGLFLRNHDELTLEMVTDEDRDYMYRVYAQDPEMRVNLGIRRRLAPLLGNDRRQIELLNSLLLSLPGTPVLYYGDEIGMGDNVYVGDRNGVRTPMQWSADRNAGFSRASPHRLYLPVNADSEYHYATVNVEAQRANSNSLFNSMKRLISTRKRFQALGRGDFNLLHPENRKVVAFTRTYENEQFLVVANLSRFVQTVELDLAEFNHCTPVEIFGRTEFPAIAETSYFLSLAPYGFYWFVLKPQPTDLQVAAVRNIPTLVVNDRWQSVFTRSELRTALAAILPNYLSNCRWFGGTRTVQAAQIIESISFAEAAQEVYLVWLQVDYVQGDPKTYGLFLGAATGERATQILSEMPQSTIARLQLRNPDDVAILFDALVDKPFLLSLLDAIVQAKTFKGLTGNLVATTTEFFSHLQEPQEFEAFLLKGEHNNTSIVYSDVAKSRELQLILKLFRRIDVGINPDLEMRRFLNHRFKNITAIVGILEYQTSGSERVTIGLLQEYIADAISTWDYTLDRLRDYFDSWMLQPIDTLLVSPVALNDAPDSVREAINPYLVNVQLLGQRTAELHLALASNSENPNFVPEAFTSLYQRSIYQYARNLTGQVFLLLKNRLTGLPSESQLTAKTVLNQHHLYLEQFRQIIDLKITALRTRYHGDYHLEQVLYTGKDFVIIDFEGSTTRSLSERRMKRSPLRDVASMLQSFHYAARVALEREIEGGINHPEQVSRMQQGAQIWEQWVNSAFLNAYLNTANQANFLPGTEQEFQLLLNHYLLEKAIYDLGDELIHPSNQIEMRLQRVLQLQTISSADTTSR